MRVILIALIFSLVPALAWGGATRGKQEMAYVPYILRAQNCLGIGPCTWTLSKEQIAGNDLAVFVMQATDPIPAVPVGDRTPVMLCNAVYRIDSVTTISGRLQTCDFSGGVNNCVSTDTAWTKVLIPGTTPTWTWRVDVTGLEQLSCSFRALIATPWNVHGILSTY